MSIEASILIAVAVLIGNAFFVAAEFALVAARRSNIELLALEGSWPARITLRAMEQVSLMLAGAQLGITLCSLVFGAVGESLAAHALEAPLRALSVPDAYLHPIALIVALIFMVYIHVLIGEMVPKNLALSRARTSAIYLAPILYGFVMISRPLIVGLNAIANAVIGLFGIKPRQEVRSAFTRDEVAGFIRESHREGILSKDEAKLLSGTLELESRTIQSIIVPLDRVTLTSIRPTAEEIEQLSVATGFSRFPIPSADGQLRGYIHLKDTLHVADKDYTRPLADKKIRPLGTVHHTASLRDALVIMQQSHSHIAQVTGEDNKTIGILMLEDVFEELIGQVGGVD